MKDEKMEMCACGCHHGGGKHLYMLIGSIAFVYGLMSYLMAMYGWPAYAAWMVGGVLLVLIGWVKKWMYMQKGM
ncbi:MAG TPA: hypothetical protein VLB73_05235 [Patescibacteria group bacterium]|nr:hypothetical protein [Patescibacteria group bacterium]